MAFNNQSYQLTFAGVPFVGDRAAGIPLFDNRGMEAEHHPARELIDELNKMIPWEYLRDFALPDNYPGKNTYALAHQNELGPKPDPDIRIGDWYYPTGVRRWSVFRGLATSSQVKAMLAACTYQFTPSDTGFYSGEFTGYASGSVPFSADMNYPMAIPTIGTGTVPGQFVISCKPEGARNPTLTSVTTGMYMLPPRPLGELAGKFDGLYLVTLVDERYYMQNSPASLQVQRGMTWEYLLNELAITLGIELSTQSVIESVYGYPELDSQLWTNQESASALLEAVAYNVGRVVVRQYDGTYTLYTPLESQQVANANRGIVNPLYPVSGHTTPFSVIRTAGGDMFYSGTALPAGSLTLAKNWVVPNSITVTFPKYVVGNDPVPHFVDKRTQSERTAFYEDSYGDTFPVNVPIQSGGINVSGLVGQSDMYLHDTAKALLSGEVSIDSGTPLNHSGLVALSMRLAQDHYNSVAATGLDEVYPGILKWEPEGLHDLLFTYSERHGGAFTRAMRKSWTDEVEEFQHATPNASGFTYTQPSLGGKAVSQVIRDSFGQSGSFVGLSGTVENLVSGLPLSGTWVQSGSICTTLGETLLSGAVTAKFASISHFPTQNRWWGKVTGSGLPDEVMLFEGTSGGRAGVYSGNYVGIVQRGAAGTIQRQHENQSFLQQTTPDAAYNVNLTTYEQGQFVYPQEVSSGGMLGVRIVPQTQSVRVLDTTGVVISGVQHFSGRVSVYDASRVISGGPWLPTDYVWVVTRNSGGSVVLSGMYDGQLVGYSVGQSGADSSPIYAVDPPGSSFSLAVGTSRAFSPTGNLTASWFSGINRIAVNTITFGSPFNRRWMRLYNTSGPGSFGSSGWIQLLVEGNSGGITSGALLSGFVFVSGGASVMLSNTAGPNAGFFLSILKSEVIGTPPLISGGVIASGVFDNIPPGSFRVSSGVNVIQFVTGRGAVDAGGMGVFSYPGEWNDSSGVYMQAVQPQMNWVYVTNASGIYGNVYGVSGIQGPVRYDGIVLSTPGTSSGYIAIGSDVSFDGPPNCFIQRAVGLGGIPGPGWSFSQSGKYEVPVESGVVYLGVLTGYSNYVSGNTVGISGIAIPVKPVYTIVCPTPETETIYITERFTGLPAGENYYFGEVMRLLTSGNTGADMVRYPNALSGVQESVIVRGPCNEPLITNRSYMARYAGIKTFTSGTPFTKRVYIADHNAITVGPTGLLSGEGGSLLSPDTAALLFQGTSGANAGLFLTTNGNNLSGFATGWTVRWAGASASGVLP